MNQEDTRACVLGITDNSDAELGMHIHPWLTPPRAANEENCARNSFLHNRPTELIHRKLDSVWQLFEQHNRRPVSFRGGRYSCCDKIQKYLQHPDRQFVADASVVPFTTWSDDGAPDYRHRNHLPYRVPPTEEGASALWEIPVTLGYTNSPIEFWAKTFNRIENSFLRHLKLVGMLNSSGLVRRVWLNFEVATAKDIIALLLLLEQLDVPCVTLTIHSSSLLAGGNPYSQTQKRVDEIFACVEEVLAFLAGRQRYTPVTIGELANQLETEHESHRYQSAG